MCSQRWIDLNSGIHQDTQCPVPAQRNADLLVAGRRAVICAASGSLPDSDKACTELVVLLNNRLSGVLTMFIARVVMPLQLPGTSWTIGLVGLPTVAVMSSSNFSLDSDYSWVLLVPALLWLASPMLCVARR